MKVKIGMDINNTRRKAITENIGTMPVPAQTLESVIEPGSQTYCPCYLVFPSPLFIRLGSIIKSY